VFRWSIATAGIQGKGKPSFGVSEWRFDKVRDSRQGLVVKTSSELNDDVSRISDTGVVNKVPEMFQVVRDSLITLKIVVCL